MNHQDAVREMSVERYLMGELAGEGRQSFEEHLFDCQQCASSLTEELTLLNAARAELMAVPRLMPAAPAKKKWLAVFSPVWLVPALAASLCVVAYQSLVVLPQMHQQLAQAEAPAILSSLVLTGTRRGAIALLPRVQATAAGWFLLTVDIPGGPTYTTYRCSLYSPAGKLVWQAAVSAAQARDSLAIHIPAAITQAGKQTLIVEAGSQSSGPGGKLDTLATYEFLLDLHN